MQHEKVGEEDPERELVEALVKRLRLSLPAVDVTDDEMEPPADDHGDDLQWLADLGVQVEER